MICQVPFTTLYVHGNLTFTTCCPTWLERGCIHSYVKGESAMSVWNSTELRKARSEWLSCTPQETCSKCPLYATRDKNVMVDGMWQSDVVDRGPTRIYLSDERACNLHCWTCRSSHQGPSAVREKQAALTRKVIDDFIQEAEWLSMLHSGEVFASTYHVDILRGIDASKCPKLGIELFTNGILLPRRWPELENIHPIVQQITMSIDAASKDVYEKVRAPAKWEQIQETLRFVSKLRDGGLPWFQCNFVARRTNMHDIIPFVDMCLDHGATMVRYSIFDKTWMSEEAYRSEICYDDPEFHSIVNNDRLNRPEVNIDILRAAASGAQIMA